MLEALPIEEKSDEALLEALATEEELDADTTLLDAPSDEEELDAEAAMLEELTAADELDEETALFDELPAEEDRVLDCAELLTSLELLEADALTTWDEDKMSEDEETAALLETTAVLEATPLADEESAALDEELGIEELSTSLEETALFEGVIKLVVVAAIKTVLVAVAETTELVGKATKKFCASIDDAPGGTNASVYPPAVNSLLIIFGQSIWVYDAEPDRTEQVLVVPEPITRGVIGPSVG